ncbi:O-methyltransferase [Mycoplasmatota bacterium WC30]
MNQINPKRTNEIIEKILIEAKTLSTPIISDDAINFIIQIIKSCNTKQVLEIGSAIGYSAIMIASFTNAKVLTIERDEASYLRAKSNIKAAGLESKITLVLADALEYQISEDFQCDLLFIDASKSSYIRFFEKYEKYVIKNGLIISDNLLFRGFVEKTEKIESRNRRQLVGKIRKFNEYIIKNQNFDSYIYSIGDGLSISIKK